MSPVPAYMKCNLCAIHTGSVWVRQEWRSGRRGSRGWINIDSLRIDRLAGVPLAERSLVFSTIVAGMTGPELLFEIEAVAYHQ